jgi:hypothetical protein
MGLGWPGSWTAKVSWCWKSIGLTAPPAAGGASRTRSALRLLCQRYQALEAELAAVDA